MSDAGSDIDDDQLNSLLFTDSDEDNSKKPAARPAPKRPSPVTSRRPSREEQLKASAAPPAAKPNDMTSLDDNLFGGVVGPSSVSAAAPRPRPMSASGARKGLKKRQKARTKSGGSDTADEPKMSRSRDEALRLLAAEDDSEKTLLEATLSSTTAQTSTPAAAPSTPAAAGGSDPQAATPNSRPGPKQASSHAALDFSSDDDGLLDDMDDKPSPSASVQAVAQAPAAAADPSPAYVPSAGSTTGRRMQLPPRAGRRVGSTPPALAERPPTSDHPVSVPAPFTAVPAPARDVAGTGADRTNLGAPLQSPAAVEPLAALAPTPSPDLPITSAGEQRLAQQAALPVNPVEPIVAPVYLPALSLPASQHPVQDATPNPVPTSVAPVAPPAAVSAPALDIARPSPTPTVLPISSLTSTLYQSTTTAPPAQRSLLSPQEAPPMSSYMPSPPIVPPEASRRADASEIARLQSIIRKFQDDLDDAKRQLAAQSFEHQRQCVALAEASHERERQIRAEEEARLKSQMDAMKAMEEQKLQSQRRIHELEIASIKRQIADGSALASLAQAVERSAQTVDGIQKEVRLEIEHADEMRREDFAARERHLVEREKKLGDEVRRHAVVIATFEKLKMEHDAERSRVREDEKRLEALQEFWMSESASLKAQINEERAALTDEKRAFAKREKEWKMEVAAAHAEIDFLKEKAMAKLNEANAGEVAAQKAFGQAQRMVLAEGEAARKDRELAAQMRAQIEDEKAAIGRQAAEVAEQRRELDARMRDVMALGEKVRRQSEAVTEVHRKAVLALEKASSEHSTIDAERNEVITSRRTVDEMRAFIQQEQKRVEEERVNLLRQRQMVMTERREWRQHERRHSQVVATQGVPATKAAATARAPSSRIATRTFAAPLASEPDPPGHARLTAEQQSELFRMRLRARTAAEYARGEHRASRLVSSSADR